MLHLKTFCFNPFQENTYLLYTDDGEAWIFDPGNSNVHEDAEIKHFIEERKLRLTRFLLTHAHIDHILGSAFIHATYGLLPEAHEAELFFVKRMPESARMYGVQCEPSPMPEKFLKDGEVLRLGNHELLCIHAPGHSPGSICFFNKANNILIGGDVLFYGSIGRSDLPMGDHDTLLASIHEKILPLGDTVNVYSGHGPATTIGHERTHNPFLV